MDKPKDIQEYKEWLNKTLNLSFTPKDKSYYETVSDIVRIDIEKRDFWKQFLLGIESFNNEYFLKTGYYLTTPNHKPEILIKDFDSIINKSYRKNVLLNRVWPQEPKDGWIVPENWFEKTNDIVRTTCVVKYLDGIEFIIVKLKEICAQLSIEHHEFYEARDEGYYAVHFYIYFSVPIPTPNWDFIAKKISLEVQITTQLQEVIKKLTHEHYQERRIRIEKPSKKWQWDYKSDEFSVNYLGHILHYIEGMIMEIREKQNNIKGL